MLHCLKPNLTNSMREIKSGEREGATGAIWFQFPQKYTKSD